jgi:hypothetical protein
MRILKGRDQMALHVTLTLVIASLLFIAFGFLLWNALDSPFEKDPNLVKTTRPTTSFAGPGTGFATRIFWKYYEWKRTRFPNPLTYTFSASAGPTGCSIHGLLNQCMDVGGTQYLIEKNVAGGSVNFGPTNVLNGQQWITSFENALQTAVPEWWDPQTKDFRKENLVLRRYDRRTVLVLSKQASAEYQKQYPDLKPLAQPE